MSDFPDLTPEDCGRWYPGTNVAFDRMIEVDGFGVATRFPVVEVPRADVGPYEMRGRDGGPFGINSSTYSAWAGNDPPRMMGLLETLEIYGRIERARRHSDCPLAGCEDFGGQTLVPVANTVRPSWLDAVGWPVVTLSREALRRQYQRRPVLDRVPYSTHRAGKTAQMEAARTGAEAAREQADSVKAASVREARQHLQRARPKRRLDGRRA